MARNASWNNHNIFSKIESISRLSRRIVSLSDIFVLVLMKSVILIQILNWNMEFYKFSTHLYFPYCDNLLISVGIFILSFRRLHLFLYWQEMILCPIRNHSNSKSLTHHGSLFCEAFQPFVSINSYTWHWHWPRYSCRHAVAVMGSTLSAEVLELIDNRLDYQVSGISGK